jgi:hypothetical protein
MLRTHAGGGVTGWTRFGAFLGRGSHRGVTQEVIGSTFAAGASSNARLTTNRSATFASIQE